MTMSFCSSSYMMTGCRSNIAGFRIRSQLEIRDVKTG